MNNQIRIAVDLMGGDKAPEVVLEGAARALEVDVNLTLALCGAPELVNSFAADHERCEAYPTSEVIGMAEHLYFRWLAPAKKQVLLL